MNQAMTDERIDAFFAGELEDDLTDAEVNWLKKRVDELVVQKILERPGVHTHGAPSILQ